MFVNRVSTIQRMATNAPEDMRISLPTMSINNVSLNGEDILLQHEQVPNEQREWLILLLLPMILCSVTGNILVILALMIDRKLQNNINYFLQSLAVADLMVSLLVMPLGLVNDLLGK